MFLWLRAWTSLFLGTFDATESPIKRAFHVEDGGDGAPPPPH